MKRRNYLLGFYDLLLSFGAIFIGVMMVSSSYGVFIQYPEEWLSKVPFKNWVVPGFVAILVFGLGNIISAVLSLRKLSNKPWIMSAIMGGIFFVGTIAQVIILGEWYMATLQFLIISIIQVGLSVYVFLGYQKMKKCPNRGRIGHFE
ncbi:MAG: hypothetical protein K0R34_2753 [Herbinix sp.]|jgi:hypothetical protein|nr:hypothetical protein [Herbinix sp.]